MMGVPVHTGIGNCWPNLSQFSDVNSVVEPHHSNCYVLTNPLAATSSVDADDLHLDAMQVSHVTRRLMSK